MYDNNMIKEPPVPADPQVRAAKLYLMTPDAIVVILQHLMYNKNLSNFIRIHNDQATPAASDNPFNQDDYPVGTVVYILADVEDVDEEGPECQPVIPMAQGRIKGLSVDTAAGTKVYEVRRVARTGQ